jgi:hypothetical protein
MAQGSASKARQGKARVHVIGAFQTTSEVQKKFSRAILVRSDRGGWQYEVPYARTENVRRTVTQISSVQGDYESYSSVLEILQHPAWSGFCEHTAHIHTYIHTYVRSISYCISYYTSYCLSILIYLACGMCVVRQSYCRGIAVMLPNAQGSGRLGGCSILVL